ncbi:hexapeptide transferase family protein [Methanolobus psychrophilus R15]|nr:hexapeptide transferase family protein [Methanolobus psychrophilus R15]
MFSAFLEDLDSYAYRLGLPRWSLVFMFILYPNTWAIAVYRFGNWIVTSFKVPVLKHMLFIVYFIFKRFTEILTHIDISPHSKIGKGIFIGHIGGLVIAANSVIGDNPSFHQWNTIGGAGRGPMYGVPTVGNNVYLGAGAQIIGNVKVGNDVMIGANAVVVKDVPDNAVVGGIPAKVLSYEGSMDFVHFRDNK